MARNHKKVLDGSIEKYEGVCKENKTLLNNYITYCQSVGRSDSTIKSYKSDLQIIMVFFKTHFNNKSFVEIKKIDIIEFQTFCLNNNISPARIRRLRSVMSSLSQYIENILDDVYPDFRNIINKIEAPVASRVREKTILKESELAKLLDELVKKGEYQKACALSLAASSGVRKSELLRFKVSYFDKDNIRYGSLYKTHEKIKTKGRGKYGKMLHKYIIASQFDYYLALWLMERDRLGVNHEYLFVEKTNDSWDILNIQKLDNWGRSFSRILGINFYWHAMRSFFTTGLVKARIPADIIKQIIGWESVEMVSIYNDTDIDDELEKYFQEGGQQNIEKNNLGNL